MYNKAINEGFDIILASRQNRQDDFLKKLFSRIFYKILSYLTDTDLDASIANFALYHRKVVDALKSMNDYYRYYPTMIHWIGFKMAKLDIQHASREDGIKSSYNFKKRLTLAFNTIISFSDKPLRLTVKLGLLISLISTIFAILLIILYFLDENSVSGWSSTFASLWFLSGLMITILGMVGIYVGKIFENVKGRPTYIVGERLNYNN